MLKTNGDVLITGYNNWGQLGDGTLTDKNRFAKVLGMWDIALENTLLGLTPNCNPNPNPTATLCPHSRMSILRTSTHTTQHGDPHGHIATALTWLPVLSNRLLMYTLCDNHVCL